MFRFRKKPIIIEKSDQEIICQNLLLVYSELNNNGLRAHSGLIKRAIKSIYEQDSERFVDLITNSGAIGGSGSILDLDLGSEFDNKFCKLLKSITNAGVDNKRLNRTIKLLERLEKRRVSNKESRI